MSGVWGIKAMTNSKEINSTKQKDHERKCLLMSLIAFIVVGADAILSGLLEKAGLIVTFALVLLVTAAFSLALPKYKDE